MYYFKSLETRNILKDLRRVMMVYNVTLSNKEFIPQKKQSRRHNLIHRWTHGHDIWFWRMTLHYNCSWIDKGTRGILYTQ